MAWCCLIGSSLACLLSSHFSVTVIWSCGHHQRWNMWCDCTLLKQVSSLTGCYFEGKCSSCFPPFIMSFHIETICIALGATCILTNLSFNQLSFDIDFRIIAGDGYMIFRDIWMLIAFETVVNWMLLLSFFSNIWDAFHVSCQGNSHDP